MKYREHTLQNGLSVILAPLPAQETATAILMSGNGSRFESEPENGLAHFLEHMFFKGTVRRPSARAISEELDGLGAHYNAFTGKDKTAYWAKVRAQYLPDALEVLTDIFLNSTLPQEEIEKERGAIIQEINMYEDMPMRTVDNLYDELFFGGAHPLGRTILGSKENILRFSREDFTRYLKRNYTPENTVVCVAGLFDEDSVLKKLEREFGGLQQGTPPRALPFTLTQTQARSIARTKNTDQTHLMLGFPGLPYAHEDEYALVVLATILGGGMSSRLFLEVREKRGLAYSVHAWTERYPDCGYFAVQAGVEHDKLEESVRTIRAEIEKTRHDNIPSTELEKAKRYLAGTMTLSLESSDEIATHAASSRIALGRIRPLSEMIDGIMQVGADQILRVAHTLFAPDTFNLAVLGPHNQETVSTLVTSTK
jgi:predicted Zn-dependent peptidase